MIRALRPSACIVASAVLFAAVGPSAHAHGSEAAKPQDHASATAGLGRDFHSGRRAKLVEELKKLGDGGIVVLRGLPTTRDYARFHQDKTFWYLTGVESPNASLVIDLSSGASTLFLPSRNANEERWEGEIWDAQDAWVKDVTGIDDVRPSKELVPLLTARAADAKVAWISLAPWVGLSGCFDRAAPFDGRQAKDVLDGRASRETALQDSLRERFGYEVKDCSGVLAEMRRVKTTEELAALRRAADAGAHSMKEAIRSTRAGLVERDLEALMTFVFRRNGAEGPAYHGIVGCGPNALTLHYSAVTRDLRDGEMLLLDYAPEFDHYVSDITRSWPVSGEWNARMIEIYDAVLEAQLAGIAAVQPGKKIEDIEAACSRALAKHGLRKLMPHGACHYVGMEVHDVGSYSKPLEPGVVFTIEPGVYDAQSGIGVRIEDVVVVTATGCEVITSGVPKDRASLSALVAEAGLYDVYDPKAAAKKVVESVAPAARDR